MLFVGTQGRKPVILLKELDKCLQVRWDLELALDQRIYSTEKKCLREMRRTERSTLRQIFEHVRLYNCLLKILNIFNMIIRKLRKMLKTIRNGTIT